MLIDVNAIIPNPHQPRRNFDEDALAALAASMHANGLVQSITVEEVPEGYQLIAGERRWRAAKMLRLAADRSQRAPFAQRRGRNLARAMEALVENIQRADLNAVEEAQAYHQLKQLHGLTVEQIARAAGVSIGTVYNRLEILNLDEPIQQLIAVRALPADRYVVQGFRRKSATPGRGSGWRGNWRSRKRRRG